MPRRKLSRRDSIDVAILVAMLAVVGGPALTPSSILADALVEHTQTEGAELLGKDCFGTRSARSN
jgi:hypothetical protein